MKINTVTVLGANGTMGKNVAAIFASFGSAKVYMICRDTVKAEKAKIQAYQSIKSESIKDKLVACTFDDLPQCISQSDLIFESLSEDFQIKLKIYDKIKPYLKESTIIGTGSSGLSISELSKKFGEKANRFFGIHMFNPPYNLTLCELISHDSGQKQLSKELSDYLSKTLFRTVVEVKDSPSFLGNRIGFFFINEALKLAEENKENGGIDYIDSILGGFTGRSMAPLTTADFVGLDVTKSIINYIHSKNTDGFTKSFSPPKFLNYLVEKKMLGRKVNKGLYKLDRDTKKLYVFDIKQNSFRLTNQYEFYFSNEMIKNIRIGNYKQAISILLEDESKEACICKIMLLKYILYSLKISSEVSTDITSCDDAMATGFSWIPPLALLDLLGGISKVQELTKKYLDDKYQLIAFNQKILDVIPMSSKYDYRPFLNAKY